MKATEIVQFRKINQLLEARKQFIRFTHKYWEDCYSQFRVEAVITSRNGEDLGRVDITEQVHSTWLDDDFDFTKVLEDWGDANKEKLLEEIRKL